MKAARITLTRHQLEIAPLMAIRKCQVFMYEMLSEEPPQHRFLEQQDLVTGDITFFYQGPDDKVEDFKNRWMEIAKLVPY